MATEPSEPMMCDGRGSLRFALIGAGGIARSVLHLLAQAAPGAMSCVAMFVRPGRGQPAEDGLCGIAPVTESLDDLLRQKPDIVVECAGHEAVRQYAECVLNAGCALLVISSGALADAGLEARLRQAASRHGTRMIIPAGALVGIDALAAARFAGLSHVRYRGLKPVQAWRGTAAEQRINLDELGRPAVFFQGTAREAAASYPQNANVTATVALAGLGFDDTVVELIADPTATRNIHEVEFAGAFGQARVEVSGLPSPTNPRTSVLTALSIWRALVNEAGAALVI